jgi:hypothetical protein
MRKEAGCKWYHSLGLPLSYSREIFKQIGAGPIL